MKIRRSRREPAVHGEPAGSNRPRTTSAGTGAAPPAETVTAGASAPIARVDFERLLGEVTELQQKVAPDAPELREIAAAAASIAGYGGSLTLWDDDPERQATLDAFLAKVLPADSPDNPKRPANAAPVRVRRYPPH